MTIDRTSARIPAALSEQERTDHGSASVRETAAPAATGPSEDGPLHALTRSKSLPARLDSASGFSVDTSRPRRRIAPSAPAAHEHRVDIEAAREEPSPSPRDEPSALASSVARAARALIKMSDVRTLLTQADDRTFIAALNHIGDRVFQMFAGPRTQSPSAGSVRIEELPSDGDAVPA